MNPTSDQISDVYVSVIIPTFNRAYCIERSIRSVLSQTFTDLELIVADDGSTDRTEEICRAIPDPRFRYVRAKRNAGPAAARNMGISHARGKFVAFHDSDDEWLLTKLETQLEVIQSLTSDYGATFGSKLVYGRDREGQFGQGLACVRPDPARVIRSGDMQDQILLENMISPQTLLVSKNIVDTIRGFDENLTANEDWEFMIRLSGSTKIHFEERPLVVQFMSSDSISQNKRKGARSYLYILKKHHSLFDIRRDERTRRLLISAKFLLNIGKGRSAMTVALRAVHSNPFSIKVWVRLVQATYARMGR